jgi:hypothetical protein
MENSPKGVFSGGGNRGMVCNGDHIPLGFGVSGSVVLLSSGNGTKSGGVHALSSYWASSQEPPGWLIEARQR